MQLKCINFKFRPKYFNWMDNSDETNRYGYETLLFNIQTTSFMIPLLIDPVLELRMLLYRAVHTEQSYAGL